MKYYLKNERKFVFLFGCNNGFFYFVEKSSLYDSIILFSNLLKAFGSPDAFFHKSKPEIL